MLTYLAIIDGTGSIEIKAPSIEDQRSIWGDDNRGADFVLEAGSFIYLKGQFGFVMVLQGHPYDHIMASALEADGRAESCDASTNYGYLKGHCKDG